MSRSLALVLSLTVFALSAACSDSATPTPDVVVPVDMPVIVPDVVADVATEAPPVTTPDAVAMDLGLDAPPADATADAGGTCESPQSPEGECGTCMGTACCQALTDCATDDDCWTCVSGVGGPICHRNADTSARADAFWACEHDSCPTECLAVAPATVKMPECSGFATGACGTCLEANCCTEVAYCADNQDCSDCVGGGGEAACHRSSTGHALAESLFACVGESCMADCQ